MGNITSSSSFTDYRWLKPVQDPHGRDYYTPLPLNRMLTIESKYKKYKHREMTQSEKSKYNFDFDAETLRENDVINYRKLLPIEDLNVYRHLRNSRNPFQLIKPEKRNSLEDLRVFYFSSLFAHCQIDYKDNFILQFTNHVSIIHEDVINIFTKNLPLHLEKVHNISKETFNFTKIRNILAKDFASCPNLNLSVYSSYFIRNLYSNNFHEIIPQLAIEEGDIFTNINRAFTNKQINDYILFYMLCLLYVFDMEANHTELDISYKNLEAVDLNVFKKNNMLMSFELMSTTKNPDNKKYMKNIVEISYERIINKNWYLSFKGLDTERFSQYKSEQEILVQPYCVFEVVSVEPINDKNYYIKLFMKSKCLSDCGQLNMSPQMQLSIGLCTEAGNDINEMYPNIELDKVASLTITSKESLHYNLSFIGCMKNLRVLDIKNLELTDDDLIELIPYISNCTFLNYLNISMNNIGPVGIAELVKVFKMMPFIEYLNLNQNNLGDKGAIELANGILSLQQLRSLNLIYNQIKYRGIEALGYSIAQCPKLKMLNLSTNFVYHEEMDALIWGLGNLKQLTYLNLSNNQISSEGLALIGDILPDTIQNLNFSENEITQEGIMDFSTNLKRVPNLLRLILYGNINGPSGISCLVQNFQFIPKLQVLNLGCNYIGDQELMLLSQNFDKLPNLEILNLRENQITNDGIVFILGSLCQLISLTTLHLGWNSISGDALNGLALCVSKLKQFSSLNLDSNPISVVALKTFLNELKEFDPNWVFNKGEYNRVIGNDKVTFAETYILQKKTLSKEILSFKNFDNEHLVNELSHLEKYEHVKHLILARDKLKLSSLKILVSNIKYLSLLREIDMRCNEIGDEGLIELSKGFKCIPLVETINLRENNIGDSGIKVFAANLNLLSNLRSLNLNWNLINDEGMKALSHANLINLELLKLKENNIGKEGMIEFSHNLNNFINLRHLDLGWNSIGGEGMKEFSHNMHILKDLNFLLLSKNEIGDFGIKEFASNISTLQHLETLLLWNNKIGDEGGESLIKEIERCGSLKTLDISINIMREEVKQKYRDLGDRLKISIDI